MPQFVNVVLKDSAGVNHTFTPRSIAANVATLAEPNGGVPIADRRLSFSGTRTADSGREKRTIKLAIPVVQDALVGGVSKPTVVRVAYADVSFNFDQSSSTQERADTVAMLAELFKSTTVFTQSFVKDLEGIY